MRESQPRLDPLVLRAITRGRLRDTPRVALAMCSHDMRDGRVEVCATNVWGSPYLHGIFTPDGKADAAESKALCEAYIMRRARMEAELAALAQGSFAPLAVGDEFMVGDEILWVSAKTKAGKLTVEPIATRWYEQGQMYDILMSCGVYYAGRSDGWEVGEGETKLAANGWETLWSRSVLERLVRDPANLREKPKAKR